MAGAAALLLDVNCFCFVACDARPRDDGGGGRTVLGATWLLLWAPRENNKAAAAASTMLVVGRGHLAGIRPSRRSSASSSEAEGEWDFP